MRINKYLASIGVASRRSIDEMIEEGRVLINGKQATVGIQVNPEKDKIIVNGNEVVGKVEANVYIVLNKPAGYTSTVATIKGEKNVLELVKSKSRIYPVGRLDRDSTGLILLTNDGELAQKLTHPKFHTAKVYNVKVLGKVRDDQLEKIRTGMELDDGRTKPAKVKIKSLALPRYSVLEITLFEGKKRQIRRMMSELHLHILELNRISIGPIELGSLPIGKYRNLSKEEVESFKKLNP